MTEEEAKVFVSKLLSVRFRDFMLVEMCDEETYNKMMQKYNGDCLPILRQLKDQLPELFFTYFSDLLTDEEYDEYYKACTRSLGLH